MKVDTYSKFILLVIQIYSVKSNRISSRSSDAVSSPPVASEELEPLPYLVLVFISVDRSEPLSAYNGRACTGTLLRQDLVITLASCLLLYYDDEPDPGIVAVVERQGHRLRVHRILINPNFYAEDQDVSKAHDFGLLIVDKSRQTVFPQLPKRLETFTTIMNTCEMGGYGHTDSVDVRNFIAIRLNDTEDVEVLKSRECNARKRICLHFGNFTPCKNGNFGSPLICSGILYALNTPKHHRHRQMQLKCVNAHITLFTPIHNVKDWARFEEEPSFYLNYMSKEWFVLVLCLGVFTCMAAIYFGLMQLLQKSLDSLDPMEVMQQPMSYESHFEDDDEDWYDEQWMLTS